jgi:hypothetical protein
MSVSAAILVRTVCNQSGRGGRRVDSEIGNQFPFLFVVPPISEFLVHTIYCGSLEELSSFSVYICFHIIPTSVPLTGVSER